MSKTARVFTGVLAMLGLMLGGFAVPASATTSTVVATKTTTVVHHKASPKVCKALRKAYRTHHLTYTCITTEVRRTMGVPRSALPFISQKQLDRALMKPGSSVTLHLNRAVRVNSLVTSTKYSWRDEICGGMFGNCSVVGAATGWWHIHHQGTFFGNGHISWVHGYVGGGTHSCHFDSSFGGSVDVNGCSVSPSTDPAGQGKAYNTVHSNIGYKLCVGIGGAGALCSQGSTSAYQWFYGLVTYHGDNV